MSDIFLPSTIKAKLSDKISLAPGLTQPADPVVALMHEAVEILLRRRGNTGDSAVTVNDMEATLASLVVAINDAYEAMAKFEAVRDVSYAIDGQEHPIYFDKGGIKHDSVDGWDLTKRSYDIRQVGMYLLVVPIAFAPTNDLSPYTAVLHVKVTGTKDEHHYFSYEVPADDLFTEQVLMLTHINEPSTLSLGITFTPAVGGDVIAGEIGMSLVRI